MAHVHTDSVIIRVSKLAKGEHTNCPDDELTFDDAIIEQIESVIRELLNDETLVVEITRD